MAPSDSLTFDGLAHDDWMKLPQFLNEAEVRALQDYWEENATRARPARISANTTLNPEIRGDRILWIEPGQDQGVDALIEKLEDLRLRLGEALLLSLHDFEAHLAGYPPGALYQAHIDQPRKQGQIEGRRLISMVIYLNSNWQPSDGGELILWADAERTKITAQIQPRAGDAVLFRSDTVLHEVKQAHAHRLSIACWFRRSPPTGIF